jgi:Fe-S cluster assembly ATP-binding protein
MLEIKDVAAKVADSDKEILRGVSINIAPGEIHALMGPNGSGKSTLTHVLMGNPQYEQTAGSIVLDGTSLDDLPTYKRARAGLFATMQYPTELPGVPVDALMGAARHSERVGHSERSEESLMDLIKAEAKKLEISDAFLARGVNDEFSGGERKRMETLQLAVSNAKYAVLDEIDSGLDVDALRIIAKRVNELVATEQLGVVAITHYDRLLSYLAPTHVHIFADGKIIESGGIELARELESKGYESFVGAASQ